MFNEKESKEFIKLQTKCSDLECFVSAIKRIAYSGTSIVNGQLISFTAGSSPEQFEETLSLGVKAFNNLDEYIEKAKDVICKDFLSVYREDDNPNMTEKAFKNNLSLASIGVFSGKVVSLDFKEKGMFGGHVLGANSLDKGETFTETEM